MSYIEIIGLIGSMITISAFVYRSPTYVRKVRDYLNSLIVRCKSSKKITMPYRSICRKKDSLYYKTDKLIQEAWDKYYNRSYRPRKGLYSKELTV